MKKFLLIKNGRIIDPAQGIDKTGSLLVSEGKISGLGEIPPNTGYDIIHADGLIVCPGFIDLHCHLRQPGAEESETIASGTLAAARGGFTTICCMPNTSPPLDNKETIGYVKAVADKEGVVRVLPIGCVTKDRKSKELVDMAALASAGAIAYSDDGSPVSNANLMRQALEHSRDLGLPIIDHCEDIALSQGGQVNEGVIAHKLGLRGIPATAEENWINRDLSLAREIPGCHLHLAHVSTKGSVDLIRQARENGITFTAEVTPHHLTLTEAAVLEHGPYAKVSPPLRTKRDNDALIHALSENLIDIIATDHAPYTEADKKCDFTRAANGISVFETALGSLMRLVHEGQLSLNILVAKLTCAPARILNDDKLGTLKVSAPADITIFDPAKEWVVDTGTFVSRGKNTPLAGATLKGKVIATIYDGKLVFKDDASKVNYD